MVATTFGMAIAIAMYMIAHNSGGHVNPAVSVGMVASGVISPIQARALTPCVFTVYLCVLVLRLCLLPGCSCVLAHRGMQASRGRPARGHVAQAQAQF